MRRDKRIFKMFYLDRIKEEAGKAIEEILANPDWYSLVPHETESYMLDLIAGDWRGRYIPQHIIETFGMRLKWDSEWAWEEIDRAFDSTADMLNKALPLSHPKFEYLALHFGSMEHSADWGLLLLFELKK